jgi:hypothetical protein
MKHIAPGSSGGNSFRSKAVLKSANVWDLDRPATGEIVEVTVKHEGDNVREFYSSLPRPVRVGILATGSMQRFLNLMEELGIECLAGHPAQIRAAGPR